MTQSQNEPATGTDSQATEKLAPQATEQQLTPQDLADALSLITTLAKHNDKIFLAKHPRIAESLLTYIQEHMDEDDLKAIALQEAFLRIINLSRSADRVALEQVLAAVEKLPPKQQLVLQQSTREMVNIDAKQKPTEPVWEVKSIDDMHTLRLSTTNFISQPQLHVEVPTVRIRIDEEPLTVQNLNTAISALTELSTKYWLIARGRYADLIEYTQTRNNRFVEEANVVVTRVSYNSPFNMDWRFSATDVAEALVTTTDGFLQRRERLEKAQLENRATTQQIKEAEQKAEQDKQRTALELEKQQVEIEKQKVEVEKQRLEILSMQLDVQKKNFNIALELAGMAVDTLQPGLDPSTRAMVIQANLSSLIQLDSVKGLSVIPLPRTQSSEE